MSLWYGIFASIVIFAAGCVTSYFGQGLHGGAFFLGIANAALFWLWTRVSAATLNEAAKRKREQEERLPR